MKNKKQELSQDISRKEAIQKLGNYGKYAALTALGTYLILNPQKYHPRSISLLIQEYEKRI